MKAFTIKTSLFLATTLLIQGKAKADFEVPRSLVVNSHESFEACNQMSDATSLNRKKATAMLLWTAYCQPEIIHSYLQHNGLYTFEASKGIDKATGKIVAEEELIKSFLYDFSDLSPDASGPEKDFPMEVLGLPLLTYLNQDPSKYSVFTSLPKTLPVESFAKNPEHLKEFCANGPVSQSHFKSLPFTGGNFAACHFSFDEDSALSLPALPKIEKTASKGVALDHVCTQLRLRAFHKGRIDENMLIEYQLSNIVPVPDISIFSTMNSSLKSLGGNFIVEEEKEALWMTIKEPMTCSELAREEYNYGKTTFIKSFRVSSWSEKNAIPSAGVVKDLLNLGSSVPDRWKTKIRIEELEGPRVIDPLWDPKFGPDSTMGSIGPGKGLSGSDFGGLRGGFGVRAPSSGPRF